MSRRVCSTGARGCGGQAGAPDSAADGDRCRDDGGGRRKSGQRGWGYGSGGSAPLMSEGKMIRPRDKGDVPDDPLSRMRHSASHVMADAVKRLQPGAKVAIGPSIETGFYYDFDTEPFAPE